MKKNSSKRSRAVPFRLCHPRTKKEVEHQRKYNLTKNKLVDESSLKVRK